MAQEAQSIGSPADYVLSFWVQGVNILITDIHREAYADLEALFIIDRGLFKQYFTKNAFERALRDGLAFYSDTQAVMQFQSALRQHCLALKQFFETEISGKENISRLVLQHTLEDMLKLCQEYTKMNFEYTDRAFAHQEENEVIRENLTLVSQFKDEVRAFMNRVLFDDDGYLATIYQILEKQFSLSVSVLENLTQVELLGLYDGMRPDDRVVKRQEAFVCSYDNPIPIEGVVAQTIAERFREATVRTRQITGQVASKGLASGKVKIIPVDYSNISRMNEAMARMAQGDILVAETTAPELMVACKKAAAIVTDMGGLMSHAAIVSRELGIPCVVGTKSATRLLKDGDTIQVDAIKGLVTIK